MNLHTQKTAPSENLEGKSVKGIRYSGEWKILKKIKRNPDNTGGHFSVGYHTENTKGDKGFLKATDIGLLNPSSDKSAFSKTTQALNEQKFEREILEICNGNNMDRIVHALDYGEFESVHNNVREMVFFIVFELAQCDVRTQLLRSRSQNLSWTLNALHNLSVAVQQLHAAEISHNDIKPSNLLVFDAQLQKLADLGRATSNISAGPWDSFLYCGDKTYAAPEFWYNNYAFPKVGGRISFDVRKASDLYLLGSMAYFFITGQSLTPILRTALQPEQGGRVWTGSFDEMLPYIYDALSSVMRHFDKQMYINGSNSIIDEADELRAAVLQLCDPNPLKRGHPINISANVEKYSVERYVSLFDRISKSIRVRRKNL